MIVLTKHKLLQWLVNFFLRAKPKDCEIKFIDCNGIEVSGIEKIVVEVKGLE